MPRHPFHVAGDYLEVYREPDSCGVRGESLFISFAGFSTTGAG
jgi:hypothetical protein